MTRTLSVLFAACAFLPACFLNAQTLDDQQSAFLTLLNNYRAQNGVGALQVSATLQQSSQWMSNDMATKNYFNHTDSLGRDPFTRMTAFGYTYYPEGENIAAGNSDAQNTFTQWVNACDPDSSGACTYGHRQNMLNGSYKAIGIGRAYGGNSSYGWYWTTDFGAVVDQPISSTPPPPSVPVISSFTATPSSITAGQVSTLTWSVSGATSITINNGVGDVSNLASKAVAPSQSTTYTLTAANTAGSLTRQVTVTVSAAPPPPTQGPTAPILTSATAASSTEVDLAWTMSTSSAGILRYQIYRNSSPLAAVAASSLSYADTSVTAGVAYSYSVLAVDNIGNLSSLSNAIAVAVPGAPVSSGGACPAPATNAFTGCYYNNTTLSGNPALIRTDPQINFDWGWNAPDRSVSRGNFSVRWQGYFTFAAGSYQFSATTSDGMRVYVDGNAILNQWFDQPATMYNVQQTLSAGSHLITVEYYDASNSSSAHLTWQGSAPVVQLPSILSFTASPSSVTAGQSSTLAWSVTGASTVSLSNGIGAVTGNSKGVQPAQTTTYVLTASNSAGNSTAQVTVTVTAAPDTTAPSTPVLTSALAPSSNQAILLWSPSTDNVGVTGYQVLRNGSAVGSVSGSTLTYSDSAVTPGASYTYSIRAFDAAGNYSAASNGIAVNIPAPPVSNNSCPTTGVGAFTGCYYANATLTGTPAFVRTDSQINFDWGGNVPDRSLPRDNFSVRWQGSFTFAQGTYTFTAMASDGIRLYIDGNLVIDHWVNQTATQYSIAQSLSAGAHVVMVEYYEVTGWSTAHVSWQ